MRVIAHPLILPPRSCAAAGTTSADATEIPTSSLVSVSGADGSNGVRMHGVNPGCVTYIYNEHASNGLNIYPHSGGDINDAAPDAPITIGPHTLAKLLAIDQSTLAARYSA